MKRILAGFIGDGKAGGVDRYLLNFMEAVHGENIQIDFLTNEVSQELENNLKQYGSKLYAVTTLKHPIRQYRQVCAVMKKNTYDMVYLNLSTAIECIAAFAAKKMKVPERALHSHSSGNDRQSALSRMIYNFIHRICRLFLYKAGTVYYACSVKAGEWLYPKKIVHSDKFEVIYNAVDRSRFCYQPDIRLKMREELELEENYVIGHVGNFCYPKNCRFLIEVFEQIHLLDKQTVLLLIGTGVEFEEIKQLVSDKNLQDSVRFLGWRNDMGRLYQAMDTFLLPSRFEGLPIVGVEAQYTGLQCVFSSEVTKETQIQKECYFLDLERGPKKWAEFILKHKKYDREQVQFLKEAKNYDLEKQISQLRRIVC